LERLAAELKNVNSKDVISTRLRSQVPKQLIQIRDALLNHLMRSYTKEREIVHLEEIQQLIESYEPKDAARYDVCMAGAICQFMLNRDVAGARKLLQMHQGSKDPSVQVSLAFLDAYEGNLQEAYRRYARIPAAKFDGAFAMDIEEFIQVVLEEEPERKQLLFLTGMINHRFKADFNSARRDLKAFNNWAKKQKQYKAQTDAATKWLKELHYKR
jgi:hypothetical protein